MPPLRLGTAPPPARESRRRRRRSTSSSRCRKGRRHRRPSCEHRVRKARSVGRAGCCHPAWSHPRCGCQAGRCRLPPPPQSQTGSPPRWPSWRRRHTRWRTPSDCQRPSFGRALPWHWHVRRRRLRTSSCSSAARAGAPAYAVHCGAQPAERAGVAHIICTRGARLYDIMSGSSPTAAAGRGSRGGGEWGESKPHQRTLRGSDPVPLAHGPQVGPRVMSSHPHVVEIEMDGDALFRCHQLGVVLARGEGFVGEARGAHVEWGGERAGSE